MISWRMALQDLTLQYVKDNKITITNKQLKWIVNDLAQIECYYDESYPIDKINRDIREAVDFCLKKGDI